MAKPPRKPPSGNVIPMRRGKSKPPADPDLVTPAQLAVQLGISPQTLDHRLKKYERFGLEVMRDQRGHRTLSKAEFLQYDENHRDLGMSAVGRGISRGDDDDDGDQPDGDDVPPGDMTYAQAQLRKIKLDADLKEIAKGQKLGELLSIDDIEDAMSKISEVLVRNIDSIPSKADDIVAAVRADGVAGARAALRAIAKDIRDKLAKALSNLEFQGKQSEADRADQQP